MARQLKLISLVATAVSIAAGLLAGWIPGNNDTPASENRPVNAAHLDDDGDNGDSLVDRVAMRYSGDLFDSANLPSEETPDFQRHVVPLLGRLGCNGRADGRR